MKNRYIVTMEFYMFAENNEMAIEKAERLAKKQRQKKDNQAKISLIQKHDFGSLSCVEIFKPIY
jgi:hypothetical protein